MFDWFKKRFPNPREVQERLETVESTVRMLRGEWEETLDKVTRAAWRAAKVKTPPTLPDATPTGPGAGDPRYAHLDPVSRRIIEARRLRVAKPGGG